MGRAPRIVKWIVIGCCLLLSEGYLSAGGDIEPGGALPAGVSRQGSAGGEERAPRIEFEDPNFDFGTVYQYQEVSHKFVFRNVGDAVLKIGKVRSTCGCTPALPEKRELAPGETGEIQVEFRAGWRRGKTVKNIYVDCNDPKQPRVLLKVAGEVKVEVEVRPRGIYTGKLTVGRTIDRWVEVRAVEVPSFQILGVSTSDPELRVGEPEKLSGERFGYRLHVEFGPVKKVGRIRSEVILRTDLPHTREVTVPVYGKVAGEAKANEAADPD